MLLSIVFFANYNFCVKYAWLLLFTKFANHNINCSFHVHLVFQEHIKCAVTESLFQGEMKIKISEHFPGNIWSPNSSTTLHTSTLQQVGLEVTL
jgi:hypothetical protein